MMMHYNWVIYPEGMKRLQETGLDLRITKALRGNHEKSTTHTHLYNPEEALEWFDLIREKPYQKALPFNFVRDFGTDIYQDWHQALVKLVTKVSEEEQVFWKVIRESPVLEPVELGDDFPVMCGYDASITLPPREIWNFKKFGFDSLSNFLGTIGAFSTMKAKEYMEKGYTWKSCIGNRTFEFRVTGSEHGDFRLSRSDITPDLTLDPIRVPVLYRPELRDDVHYVSGSHSVETGLLAILLQWAEQEKLGSEILKNPQDFIESFRKQGQHIGNFADFGYEGLGARPLFTCWINPILHLDNEKFKDRHPHFLPAYGGESGGYSIRIGKNKDLIFSGITNRGEGIENAGLAVPAKDFDHFITGLFTQAQLGLGRTSVKQLADAMNYYFSENFRMDLEEMRKF